MMPLKTVEIQGRKWVLGRKAPASQERTFRSGQSLLGSTVPTPPATIAIPAVVCQRAIPDIHEHPARLLRHRASRPFPGEHHQPERQATPFIYTDNQIIKDYEAVGGYIPGDPFSDQGCDIADRSCLPSEHRLCRRVKLLGSINLDPTSQLALQQSVWITGGVCFGMCYARRLDQPGAAAERVCLGRGRQPRRLERPLLRGLRLPDIAGDRDRHLGDGRHDHLGRNRQVRRGIGQRRSALVRQSRDDQPEPPAWHRIGLNLNQICTYFNAMGGSVVVPPAPNPTPATDPRRHPRRPPSA